jgi:tripartite ATP-independent transporter DctP family solute receptor
MRFKTPIGMLALVLGAACLTACAHGRSAAGGRTYVIKFTAPDPKGTTQVDQVLRFVDQVQKDSHGLIKVQTYLNGVLANSGGGVKLTASGSAQMTYGNAPTVASYVPEYNFLQEPLLFTKPDLIAKGLASPAIKALDTKLVNKTGLRILSWGALGFVDLLNSKKPITSAADMKGMKFRVIPGSAPVTNAMQALGAQPVPLDITEVYTALEQKTIDGTIGPTTTLYPIKHWEVAKYLTIMPFQYNPMPFMINDKFFKSLPADLQQVVQKAADDSTAWEIAQQAQEASRDATLMQQHGVHVNTLDAQGLASFDAALASQRKAIRSKYSPDLFTAFGVKQ